MTINAGVLSSNLSGCTNRTFWLFLLICGIYVEKVKMKRHKIPFEEMQKIVSESFSFSEVSRKCGWRVNSSTFKIIRKYVKDYNLSISHFMGHKSNVGNRLGCGKVKPLGEILVKESYYKNSSLKKRLIEAGLKEDKCEVCGITEWQGKSITIEVHHINGDNTDNRLENLQLLCPNCHSQTDNYRNSNPFRCKQCGKIISKNKTGYCKNCLDKRTYVKHKVEKPPKEILSELIKTESFLSIGRKYGVTDNAVRKWCKSYNLPYRKKDIKQKDL